MQSSFEIELTVCLRMFRNLWIERIPSYPQKDDIFTLPKWQNQLCSRSDSAFQIFCQKHLYLLKMSLKALFPAFLREKPRVHWNDDWGVHCFKDTSLCLSCVSQMSLPNNTYFAEVDRHWIGDFSKVWQTQTNLFQV